MELRRDRAAFRDPSSSLGAGIIAIAATGMIYLSYFLGGIMIMRARARGWPKVGAPFRLGRWGLLVDMVALLYGRGHAG